MPNRPKKEPVDGPLTNLLSKKKTSNDAVESAVAYLRSGTTVRGKKMGSRELTGKRSKSTSPTQGR